MTMKVHQALNKWQRRDFTYGDSDCCQFAGFIVQEITGKDYLATFAYNDQSEAESIIKSNGDLEDTVSTVLGQPTYDVSRLPDGSPVILKFPSGPLIGVKLGKSAVCLTLKGLTKMPEEYIAAGWALWDQ